jgi:hypothetical protein
MKSKKQLTVTISPTLYFYRHKLYPILITSFAKQPALAGWILLIGGEAVRIHH